MNPTLVPGAALVAMTVLGILGLRRFSYPVRIGFDAIGFAIISVFLLARGVSPLFRAPSGFFDVDALWLRALGGAWWLLGARVLVAMLWYVFHRDSHTRAARLFSDLVAAAIYTATTLIVLNSVLALPIGSVLATSGLFAIVLGLALQNTLADVFSGIAVGIEAPFKVGDRVQIAEKIEGLVVQVNWRSIRVQTDGEDVAIIPHSLVAKQQILNRSFPTERRSVSVELPCVSKAVPELVTEILLQATLLCPAILQSPVPSATLAHLGLQRNTYRISFFVESTKDLAAKKGSLLTQARRQLYYAGLLAEGPQGCNPSSEGQPGLFPPQRMMRGLTIFECLSLKQLDALASQIDLKLLEPKETLFIQGEADATLYVLASGVLEFTVQSEGANPAIVGAVGAGEYVGEIGLLTGAPHAATATAKTRCHVYCLPRVAIAPLLAENKNLLPALDRSVRHGLQKLDRKTVVRVTEDIGSEGQLLVRIRNFFHFKTA